MTYYDEIASGYEELHSEEQLAKIGLIKDHFRVTVKDKLLDVGCGTGVVSIDLIRKDYFVHALDISQSMIALLKK